MLCVCANEFLHLKTAHDVLLATDARPVRMSYTAEVAAKIQMLKMQTHYHRHNRVRAFA